MLTDLQSQLLSLFPDASSGGLPKKVEAYGNQIVNPRRISSNLPALYVDVPQQFEVDSDDAMFQLLNMAANPELVLFARNDASGKENRSGIAELCDWVIEQLQGQTVTVNGNTLPVQKVTGNIVSDFDDKIALAVLKVQFTSFEDP